MVVERMRLLLSRTEVGPDLLGVLGGEPRRALTSSGPYIRGQCRGGFPDPTPSIVKLIFVEWEQ